MGTWSVEFTDAARREYAELPADIRAKMAWIVSLLVVDGPMEVGMPHVRPLGSKLYEIRASGRDGIARAIYFAAKGRRLVAVRVFVKKTPTTPEAEIKLALKRMEQVE
jgi:phage-related protein